MISTFSSDSPTLDIDLFSEQSLCDPFKDYKAIRDAGPAVWLPRLSVYAIGRFCDVQAALRANDVLINGEGIGFSDAWNAARKMSVLQMDSEHHTRLRNTIMKPLTPARLRKGRPELKRLISARVESLIGVGKFNAMQALASFLPLEAISHLVGIPEVGRERMLDWAAATFNLLGPNPTEDNVAISGEARAFIAGLTSETVRTGSWAGDLFSAVDSGRLSLVEAKQAISAYVIPSLDTTILSKGNLLYDLATNQDQWENIRQHPEKIPAAVSEGVRHRSVVRFFARFAAEDYLVDRFVVPKGARVMLLYGCANRDERRYCDPSRFDIERDTRDQLAWGTGAHMCLGMHLARLEMEVLLEALVEADVELEVGNPTMGLNRGLFGFADLPLKLTRRGG